MSLYGTNNEERTDLTKTESRFIRQRSRKLLGSLLLPLRARLWLAVAMIFISTTLRVAGPALIAFAIDWALPRAIEDDFYPLWMVILLYLGAAAFSALMVYYFMILTSKIAQSMLFALRNRMFVHTQKLSVEFHERYTAGRVIARQTSDLESISELLSGGLGELVVGIFFMVFTAGALLILDPISFLVLMAAGIPLAIVTRWFQINTNRGFRAHRR
jgi:ATP-binding cassette subfamily B protein